MILSRARFPSSSFAAKTSAGRRRRSSPSPLSPLQLSSCGRRGARKLASAANSPPVSAAASSLASSALSMLLNSRTAALLAGAAVALGVVSFSASKTGGGGSRFFSRPVESAWSKQVEKTLLEPAVPEPEGIAGVYEGNEEQKEKEKKEGDDAAAAAPRTLIPRPRAAAALARSLDPDDAGPFFYVVFGPPGCGKTTLVRQALRAHIDKGKKGNASAAGAAAAEPGSSSSSSGAEGEEEDEGSPPSSSSPSSSLPFGGAAYVDAASFFPLDFGRDLAAAVGFTFEEGIRTADRFSKALTGGGARALLSSGSADADAAAGAPGSSPQQRQATLARAAAALEEAAAAAAAAGRGRPLVVVDGADRLAALDPDAFLDVARLAARWAASSAGNRTPVVALVLGDPAALALLRASAAGSRALEPPIEAPGPTEAEARRFLAARGVPGDGAGGGGAAPPPPASSPRDAILEAARGDWLQLEKAARLVRAARARGAAAAGAARAAAAALVAGPAEGRFAAAGLLDDTPQQLGGLAAVRALCVLRSGSGEGTSGLGAASAAASAAAARAPAASATPPPPPPPTLPPSLWRRCVPKRELQRALLLSDPPSALPPGAARPPPGVRPPLRFVEGAGLSFASAADEAFACSLSLGGGGGGGKIPLLKRCLGGQAAWEAAGKRAAEAFLEEAAEREEEEEEVVGAGVSRSGESGGNSSSSSSGIGSLSEEEHRRAGGDGSGGRKAGAPSSSVPPTAGTEA